MPPDSEPPFWMIALEPGQRFDVDAGLSFPDYATREAYLDDHDLPHRAERGEVTLLISQGVPGGPEAFLPLLREDQRPLP
jgi:hypothetical protein